MTSIRKAAYQLKEKKKNNPLIILSINVLPHSLIISILEKCKFEITAAHFLTPFVSSLSRFKCA